jgi:hypothetical protein
MRKNDIAMVILVASLCTFTAYLILNALLPNPDENMKTISYVDVVSSDIVSPDTEVFNEAAINPTVEIYVGMCEDVDGDGELSEAERAACMGMVVQQDNTEEPQ